MSFWPSTTDHRARAAGVTASLTRCCALLLAVLLPAHGRAAELHVAVAANFLGTLQALAPMYRQASADVLRLSAGSSGQLYAQIREGAPFDVFLSADAQRPAALVAQGLAVPGSRFTYAIGTLVLWTPRSAALAHPLRTLRAEQYRYLAIADPGSAPYGTAARQVLTALHLWDTLNMRRKIVIGESIGQTWQFAASGNVDLAFVALSQVIGPDGRVPGSTWLPPPTLYAPIDQDAVLLTHASQPAAARTFLRWLRSAPAAVARIHAAGYRSAQ